MQASSSGGRRRGRSGHPDGGDGDDLLIDHDGLDDEDPPWLEEMEDASRPVWSRVPSKVLVVLVAALVGLGLLVLILDDGEADVAAIDPDTGYPWCTSADSDGADNRPGDGLGLEDGGLCRIRTPLLDNQLPGDDDEAVETLPPSTLPSPSNPESPGDDSGSEGADDGAGEDEGSGPAAGTGALPADYQANLELIRAQPWRNTNLDDSPYRNTPSGDLVPENLYGPRSEYLGNPGGNPEQAFPVEQGGQFRTACEFSHFAYDDPLVFPGQPGASHLHMFFGNTDVNAYTTADSLLNTGSATCNGMELNRTGYWAPAMFDGEGNVRIPERIVVYYKGEGLANGKAEPFPTGAAMIASTDLNAVDTGRGGAMGKFSFTCSDQWSGAADNQANTIPDCDGSRFKTLYGVDDEPHVVLEMNVKFPQCWNGQDPGNPANFQAPTAGSWYYSQCDGPFNHTLVNLEYFINYRVDIGESTADWYLSSDVDPVTRTLTAEGGTTVHADWWGAWHAATNQMFLDNCVNHRTAVPSGCGFGYLTDGGPDGANPQDGPALRYREQYTGSETVPAAQVYQQLCPGAGAPPSTPVAAYCNPAVMTSASLRSGSGPGSGLTAGSIFCPVPPPPASSGEEDGTA